MNDLSNPNPGSPPSRRHAPSLVLGVCIILFGLALTLDQLNVPHTSYLIKLWPIILIALGASKIRQCDGFSTGGFFLVLAGALFLVANFSPNSIEDFIWPLLIVGLGVFLVTKSLHIRRGPAVPLHDQNALLDATAIFSGVRRQPQGEPFKGGHATAIFGGIEIDLRTAEPSPEPMVLDVFILFGGGEIRVPPGWKVDVQATSIFGGVGHKISEPVGNATSPRLVITGTTLFGGLEIRH